MIADAYIPFGVWVALAIWLLCGVAACAMLWNAARRPRTTLDDRCAEIDADITARERAARVDRICGVIDGVGDKADVIVWPWERTA